MDVISAANTSPVCRLNLTPMLPPWARQDTDAESAAANNVVTSIPDGHYPTLPLPPAVPSAVALVAMAVALRALRRVTRYRIEFR